MLLMMLIDVSIALKMTRLYCQAAKLQTRSRERTISPKITKIRYSTSFDGGPTNDKTVSVIPLSHLSKNDLLKGSSNAMKNYRNRRTLSKHATLHTERDQNIVGIDKDQHSASVACIIVALVFIALTFPSCFVRARVSFSTTKDIFRPTEYEIHLMKVFEKIFQLNGIYKFFIYFTVIPSFRIALFHHMKNVFRRTCSYRQTQNSSNLNK